MRITAFELEKLAQSWIVLHDPTHNLVVHISTVSSVLVSLPWCVAYFSGGIRSSNGGHVWSHTMIIMLCSSLATTLCQFSVK